MNRIILETHEPIISTYPHHACLFSILDEDARSLSWIFHNYLLLMIHCDYETGGYGLDLCSQYYPWHQFKWATCPMIISRTYQKELIFSKWNLSDFIIDLLRQNNYVYFLRDLGSGFFHETFISGVDLDNKMFLIHDFFDGFYKKKWMPFDVICLKEDNAFYAEWATDYLNGIWAIQKTQKYQSVNQFYYETVLNFTKKDFMDVLKEYVGANNYIAYVLSKDKRFIGIDVYDIMIAMLEKYKKVIKKPFAMHPFSILCDHKKLLSLAVKFVFGDNSKINKSMSKLVDDAHILKNMMLYCNYHIEKFNTYNKFDEIIRKIRELKITEFELMQSLLKSSGG